MNHHAAAPGPLPAGATTPPAEAANGLAATEAAARLRSGGFNELPAPKRRGTLRILLEVVRQPMFALLLGGGVIYLILGSRLEALLLLLFACLSVAITIVQESRSERVLEALRNLASPRARVVRDGRRILIPGREVVCGDLMVLAEGDRVAADATLSSSQDLLVDESLLTGESAPVRKTHDGDAGSGLRPPAAPGGDDPSRVFAGTLVVRGSGQGVVQAIGARSEMGRIGHALQKIETEQPHLQRQIGTLVRYSAIAGAAAGALTVLLYGLLRGSWLEALLGGIAIGMSLLPEEFPLVLAVFMAMGAWRISKARVLTRRAAAIETLGATTVLCTDKTGTLTENRMTVVALRGVTLKWDSGSTEPMPDDTRETLQAALLACPRSPTDPMDAAIHSLALQQLGSNQSSFDTHPLIRNYGLRPDLFVVTNVVKGERGELAFAKGAPEAIADLCHLGGEAKLAMHRQIDALAEVGVRILGLARANLSSPLQQADLPDTPRAFPFEYIGLIGFTDPLRRNVPDAVAECRSAGIRVIMITGDYPVTARAIARQAGLDASAVMTGAEMSALSEAQLATAVQTTSIFARIRPEQKLRIVTSLKRHAEVVAMTGDGVNDAPAIKAAHIGIAMGGRGSDVAREASAIVLLDDDFGSIVKTIRLGRRIYDNLRKAIEFVLAVHIPIAGLAILPLLFGLPLILTPIHIAFLEMVIDPACSVVFEAEQAENNIMRRPPRNATSSLLEPRRILWALLQGVIVFALLAAVFLWAAGKDLPEPDLRAIVFTSLIFANVSLILVNRSFSASLMAAFRGHNRALWVLLVAVAVVLAAAIYTPAGRALFHFGRLTWADLLICAGAGLSSLLLLEGIKRFWYAAPSVRPEAAVQSLPAR